LVPDLARVGVRRILAFGTTGRFYKGDSSDPREREHVRRIETAEGHLVELCDRYEIAWTLFRPTLVYGCGLDRSVMFIARCVRRFGFFPVVGDARGLRQPVHAEDVASACVAVLDKAKTFGKAYNLSGGSTLTYRQMVEAVFSQLRRPVRIFRMPLPVFRVIIAIAKLLPGLRGLSTEMATRMNTDMCFDHSEAASDFGFSPRPFVLDERALPLRTELNPTLTRAGLKSSQRAGTSSKS
jgi:nucleoside-diphosphate-sugar epimerase